MPRAPITQQMSAIAATMLGVPGLYAQRVPSVLFQPPGTLEATSFYDTTLLKATLERLIDFDLINFLKATTSVSASAASMRPELVWAFGLFQAPRRISSGPRTLLDVGEWRAAAPWFPALETGADTPGMAASSRTRPWNGSPDIACRTRSPSRWISGLRPASCPKMFPMAAMTPMKEILNWSRTIYHTDKNRGINHLYATLFRFLGQVPEELEARGARTAEYLVSVATPMRASPSEPRLPGQ